LSNNIFFSSFGKPHAQKQIKKLIGKQVITKTVTDGFVVGLTPLAQRN